MSEALLSALTEALADLVTAVETADDEVLDPDTAVKWLESTGYVLGGLPAADRRALDRLFRDAALRRPPGPRRDELLKVSEGLGLTADDHAVNCERVASAVESFVTLVRGADPATPVPTCPGWTLADLVKHHGTTHRWTEHLVRTRATERVWSTDVPLDLPEDPAAYPEWLAASAEASLRALRAAEPDAPTWSHGADPHVRFFPRRLLFEAVVHRADAERALGREPGPIDPGTAADGIEEFLENLPYFSWVAEPVARLGRDGARLRLAATDSGAAWTLTLGGGGFTWQRRADGEATATVEGTAADLLLLVYGRYAADDPRFTHAGDRTVLDAWRAATAL
ncbi:maleylpyruvate isomerase family mycothiol-dependent enzyme [Streptomyces sp. NPDC053431]|uniref:maleylpyruvate isomerase family mycothiol-dependent enzyme n=1 Tax=Streptomyces sp. NPDC053431 TaxID=3365703 RepID=UPI0037D3B410